jgi:hypothetical protein
MMNWQERCDARKRIETTLSDALHSTYARDAAPLWRETARLAMAMAAECEDQFQQKVVLTIPGDVARDLSPNLRLHWRERANRTHRWRAMARLIWQSEGSVRFKPGVSIHITVRRGRLVDRDNCISSCKVILDSLWGDDGMLGADDARWVKSIEVIQETGGKWTKHPEVKVEVAGEVE